MEELEKFIPQSFDLIQQIEKNKDQRCLNENFNDIEKYVECKFTLDKMIKNIKKKFESRIVFLENEYLDCTQKTDQETCRNTFLNKFNLELEQIGKFANI